MTRREDHLSYILAAADAFGAMLDDVVFVGGAVTGLLITDPGAADVRPTDDVDVVIEARSYGSYAEIQDRLRKLGFVHDMNGPHCRFIVSGLKIDVMPSEGKVLNFNNRFYPLAMKGATRLTINGRTIRLITAPHFICTKLEAFLDRGNGDYLASADMEDIITVVDGRKELVAECSRAEAEVREYLARQCKSLLEDRRFRDCIGAHLLPDALSQERAEFILSQFKKLALLSGPAV